MKKMIMIMALLMVSISTYAGGKEYFATNCASCHGATAQGQGMFPKLAGKDAKFITAELVKFKAKTRKMPFPVPVKDTITDEQAKEVAEFIATLK